jgi:hypothetical protein
MMCKRRIRGAEEQQHGGGKGGELNFHESYLLGARSPE